MFVLNKQKYKSKGSKKSKKILHKVKSKAKSKSKSKPKANPINKSIERKKIDFDKIIKTLDRDIQQIHVPSMPIDAFGDKLENDEYNLNYQKKQKKDVKLKKNKVIKDSIEMLKEKNKNKNNELDKIKDIIDKATSQLKYETNETNDTNKSDNNNDDKINNENNENNELDIDNELKLKYNKLNLFHL